MPDCKVKTQTCEKQPESLDQSLPNTSEYPGWSVSQFYGSAFWAFQRLTYFTNQQAPTTVTSENSSQAAVWVQVCHTGHKICCQWVVLLGLTATLHPVIFKVKAFNKDKVVCLAVHRLLQAFVLPSPCTNWALCPLSPSGTWVTHSSSKHNTFCCLWRDELLNACVPLQTTNIS